MRTIIRAACAALALGGLAACGAAERPAASEPSAIPAEAPAIGTDAAMAPAVGAPSLADAFEWPAASDHVRISTSKGDMIVELYADKAPQAVANFLQYASDGHYNGTIFHRVVEDLVVQGGGYGPDFAERPTRAPIGYEGENGLPNYRSTLAAARGKNPNSATAQWYINLRDNQEKLDHATADEGPRYGYAVFGRVIEGMSVAEAIGAAPTGSAGPFAEDIPLEPVMITLVERLAGPPARAE